MGSSLASQPWMTECLAYCHTLRDFGFQDSFQKRHCIRRDWDILRKPCTVSWQHFCRKTFADRFIDCILLFLAIRERARVDIEWRIPKQHAKHNHSDGPHVCRSIIFALQYLRSSIVRSAHNLIHLFQSRHDSAHTKINQFDGRVLVGVCKHDVVWFQIQVSNVVCLHVAQCLQYLFGDGRSVCFRHGVSRGDALEQFTAREIIHH
mmetsp:Transcript_16731/g.25915  ORF Transcript_16731/g.25915 Transcript_16731/m.25915 type:complete len:206 (-) Transcript_16731:446-1063(-)